MALQAKAGSFSATTATAGNTQAITGVGFQPKAIIFWMNQRVDTSDAVGSANHRSCFGFAVSTSDRRCINMISQNAVGTSVGQRAQRTDAAFATISTSGAYVALMDIQSLDSDGFTLVVDAQFSSAVTVFYLALGGTSISNAKTGGFLCPVSTGNYDTTGLGFQPTVMIFAAPQNNDLSNGSSNGDASWSIGSATGSSEQSVAACAAIDGAGTSDTAHYAQHLECAVSRFDGSVNTAGREAFVSFLSDGFRLNHLEGGNARSIFYLALNGSLLVKSGTLSTATSITTVAATLGFTPAGILFYSCGNAENTQDVSGAHAKWSIGAASGAGGVAAGIRDRDNQGTTDVVSAVEFDNVYVNITNDSATVEGSMAIQSLDTSGFTCVMTNADPTSKFVGYLAFGNPITFTQSGTVAASSTVTSVAVHEKVSASIATGATTVDAVEIKEKVFNGAVPCSSTVTSAHMLVTVPSTSTMLDMAMSMRMRL